MSEFGNVIITQKGMDFVTSAHDLGVYVDIRYFVPAYDNRIDPNIRLSGYNLSSFDQVASEVRTATDSVGEILWKRSDSYTLNTNNNYIISASTFAGGQLQNSFQKSTVYTNLNNSQPISDQVSANSWAISGSLGNYNLTAVPSGIGVTGLGNTRPTSTSADFFPTGDYYPVYDTSAQGTLRGAWKCLLNQNSIGNIRFNKILLYAVAIQKVSPDVVVDTCLFGEAYIQTPVVLSNLGVGYDNVEIDVQIDISGTSANFEQLFYSSSADYWSHSPGGLYYPNKIGVGSFEDNQRSISASMHIRKARNENGQVDTNIPNIRLDYNNDRFFKIDTLSTAYDVTQTTAVGSGQLGTDIQFEVGGWTTYCGDTISIKPAVSGTIALGTSSLPFRELHLYNPPLVGKNTNNIIPLEVINAKYNYAVNINNGQVYIGTSSGSTRSVSGDPYGMRLSGAGVDITDEMEFYSDGLNHNNLYGAFRGGDIIRNYQNLLIYNGYETFEDVENIYILAGLNIAANFTSVDGQTGPTHKNIVYAIEQASPGIFCGQNTKLSTAAELHLAAKGKIGLHGPVEIQNLSEYADSTAKANAILISRNPELKILIGAGFNTSATFDYMTDRMEANTSLADLRASNTALFLAADTIYVDGSIYPTPGIVSTLGSDTFRFNSINGIVGQINSLNSDEIYSNLITTNDMYSTSGYWEKNRNFRMGSWSSEVTSEYYIYANNKTPLYNLYSNNTSVGLSAISLNLIYSVTINNQSYSDTFPFNNTDTLGEKLMHGTTNGFQQFLQSIASCPNAHLTLNSDGQIEITNVSNMTYASIQLQGASGPFLTWTNGYTSSQKLQSKVSITQSYSKVGDIFFVKGSFTATDVSYEITVSDELERNGDSDFMIGKITASNGVNSSGSYIQPKLNELKKFTAGGLGSGTYLYHLIYRGKSGI